jgi:putative phosphoribosyl transferase
VQMEEIERRVRQYRAIRPKAALAGRSVIITDDGIATGATMQAALWAARREKPEKLITAIPVGPESTIRKIAAHADEVLCLRVPAGFMAVGSYYVHFEQTEDDEVLEILKSNY